MKSPIGRRMPFILAGNAFSVTNTCKIQHGTLMLDVELPEKVEKVLINQRFDMTNVETDDEKICEIIKWLAQD